MSSNVAYALVLSLKEGSSPKIVKASEMLHLSSDFKATRMNPKEDLKFSKSKEYGRIEVVDGEKKIIRHVIFELSYDIAALKKMYMSEKRRFVAPRRLSMSPVVEPYESYTFPDEKKDRKDKKKAKGKATDSAKQLEGERVYQLFKKKPNAQPVCENKGKLQEDTKDAPCTAMSSDTAVLGDNKELIKLKSKKKKVKKNLVTIPSEMEKVSKQTNIPAESHSVNSSSEEKEIDNTNQDFSEDKLNIQQGEDGQSLTSESRPTVTKELPAMVPFGCQDESPQIMKIQSDLEAALVKFDEAMTEIKVIKSKLESLQFLEEMNGTVLEIKGLLMQIKDRPLQCTAEQKNDQQNDGANCLIKDMVNLISSDEEEEVPEGMVKVEHEKYLKKSEIARIEKATYFTPRVEQLCYIFCNKEPEKYSLTGWSTSGAGLIKITDTDIKSMIKILKSMRWSYNVEITEKKVKCRISKYTSSQRQEPTDVKIQKKLDEAAAKHKLKSKSQVKVEDEGPSHKKQKIEVISSEEDDEEEESIKDDLNSSIHL